VRATFFSSDYYPSSSHLQDDGFNLGDPPTLKRLRALLAELIDLLSDDYELNITDFANNSVTWVRVPKTSSDRSFLNSKEWLNAAIRVAGSKHGGTYEASYRITNHLLHFYRDSVLDACATQRVSIIENMTPTTFYSMIFAAGVNGRGEAEIKKHLKAHLGADFCPTRKGVSMLSDGHGVVHYNSMDFTYDGKQQSERIEWTEKCIDDEIIRYLQSHLQSESVDPSDICDVQVVVGGDHGDTAFQFEASVAVEPSNKKIIDFEVSACEIICRKDTGALLEKTILPRLTAGLRTVAESPLHIHIDEKGTISCKFGALPTQHANTAKTIEKVDLYITGDLAFQALALGKESMSGHWCMQCTKQMQCTLTPAQLNDVKLWTMNDLCRVGAEAKSKGQPIMGQKQEPWWPFIPVTQHMVPLLHCEIGIGNQLLDMLRDIINEHIKNMTPTE
jgi:hypothetical protein